MKEFAAFLIIAIISAGLYGAYRFDQSSPASVARYLASGTSISATRCDFSASQFQGQIKGTFWINGTRMRADWELNIDGEHQIGHGISEDGRQFKVWGDDAGTGLIVSSRDFREKYLQLESVGGVCAPWWMPDDSLFRTPFNVTFESDEG